MTRRMVNDGLSTQCINGLDFPAQCVVCGSAMRERPDFICKDCREWRINLTRNSRPPIGVVPNPPEFTRGAR